MSKKVLKNCQGRPLSHIFQLEAAPNLGENSLPIAHPPPILMTAVPYDCITTIFKTVNFYKFSQFKTNFQPKIEVSIVRVVVFLTE